MSCLDVLCLLMPCGYLDIGREQPSPIERPQNLDHRLRTAESGRVVLCVAQQPSELCTARPDQDADERAHTAEPSHSFRGFEAGIKGTPAHRIDQAAERINVRGAGPSPPIFI